MSRGFLPSEPLCDGRLTAIIRAVSLPTNMALYRFGQFHTLVKMSGTLTGLRSYCEPAMVDAGALAAGILSDAPKSARMGQACEEVLRQTQNKSKCDTIACPISF